MHFSSYINTYCGGPLLQNVENTHWHQFLCCKHARKSSAVEKPADLSVIPPVCSQYCLLTEEAVCIYHLYSPTSCGIQQAVGNS